MLNRLPWLIAPLGPSAVLVFVLPAGPMAQPWAAVGGNTLSALVGIVGIVVVHGVHGVYLLNQVLDVSRDDLKALLAQTQLRAYERKLAEVRCADIMSRDLVPVKFGTPLQEAWALLRERRIKALPVVDRTFRIASIVTSTDG